MDELDLMIGVPQRLKPASFVLFRHGWKPCPFQSESG